MMVVSLEEYAKEHGAESLAAPTMQDMLEEMRNANDDIANDGFEP